MKTKIIGKPYYIEVENTVSNSKVTGVDAIKGVLALLFLGCASIVAFGYFSKLLCLLGTRKEMPEFAFFMKVADVFTWIVVVITAIYAVLGIVFVISKKMSKKYARQARTLRKEFAVATARRALLANDVANASKLLVKGMNFLFKKLGKGIAWIYKM